MSEREARSPDESDRDGGVTVPLGEIDPAGTRHMWQRSAVAFAGNAVVAGTANGQVRAFDLGDGAERWTASIGDEYVVSMAGGSDAASATETLAVGGRGPDGELAALDPATGDVRWRYRTADDLGEARKDSLFFLPYVVDVAADGDRIYAAARRYERDGDGRAFESAVYAFEADGSVAWTYRADASPIAIDRRDDRVAAAYNRCPGDHQCGLVVLDAETGEERLTWDPGTDGQRRVGDVSLLPDGAAVASHGDYRGYRLDERGGVEWAVDLARPRRVGDETLYAYPNHVHAADEGVAFVTGNTFPAEGREAEGRHPNEHAVAAFAPDGAERWRASAGGWVGELAADGGLVAAPCAQHFRDRDPDAHGLRRYDLVDGPGAAEPIEGVATAAALDGDRAAAIEEPVAYHDGDAVRGAYRVHLYA